MNKQLFLVAFIGLQSSSILPMEEQKLQFAEWVRFMSKIEFENKLKQSPGLIKMSDQEGKTLLLHTIDQCDDSKFDIVLKNGASVDILDINGKNGLHHAAQSGHVHAAIALVTKRVNSKAIDGDGNTPLHLLLKNDHRQSDVAMTAQALLFSDYSEKYYDYFYDFSLLKIEDKNKKNPVDIAIACNNLPAIAIIFKWSQDEINPEKESQIEIRNSVSSAILKYFQSNEYRLTQLIGRYASSLHKEY